MSSVPDAEGALGGASPAARVLGRALDKIIKHSSWRRHAALVAASKSALDLITSAPAPEYGSEAPPSPVPGIPAPAADAALSVLLLALDPASPKVAEPALECVAGLLSLRLLLGDVDAADPSPTSAPSSSSPVSKLFAAVLSCGALGGDDALELAVLRVLLAFARCPTVSVSGECLGQVVKACYNVYLGSASGGNQLCAKLAIAQVLATVLARVEADAMDVRVRTVSAADMMDLSDRSLNDSSVVQAAQAFINEAMEGSDVPEESPPMDVPIEGEGSGEDVGMSKIREDGLALFKYLCKLSMKFATPDNPDDPLLLRGKVLSLELLRMVVDNAGPFWKTNEKYLEAIKQYLCLSLLKNSALSAMSVFQLLCSIFMSLLSRFRSGLKEEIGIFFPMLILRVLENVLQPSFLQKMTVLNFLEKICKEPQVTIDIFVNYDCDVDAPNIFERIVNGLLKTALGVPAGSTTTLTVAQDQAFRIESVKCLATLIKSMSAWMDQQLRIGEFSLRSSETQGSMDNHNIHNGEEGSGMDYELQSDASSTDITDSSSLEQRRAYKIELQKGIALFNKKPSKGIDFLVRSKKIGQSPEDVASFLRNTAGLNATMIGDYLGERDDFPLKVMHAYVDTSNFEGMDFGQAIRFFLQGFRLPGEAQKIDRIMEKFAEHYCKCNPNAFTSADTAYVLAYSVILLNTDAHNPMVTNKMSKADFMRNNRGIDNGKDLPEDYLSALYDQIVNNEIKMSADSSVSQTKQPNSVSKLLGLDNIINFVNWRLAEDKAEGANDFLIKHIQEKFKAKRGKLESTFYVVADATILRFMMESCWAPVMAAFSVPLDQCDDKASTSQCLKGLRFAVHILSVMCMQTQRDAFLTSIAKFTSLHSAADMKQKNVDAMKAIISIAIEDGNYLQEAWEHVLTCLSRFEHLHLLGEGVPTDASFLTVSQVESEEKTQKSTSVLSSKKNNALQNPAVMAAVRGGTYDSTVAKTSASALVTPEQINNFLSNINLLDQIGIVELNHIFAHSQRLNSDAIVAFVKALCKVSMTELQSPTDPRIFCLTKIVEIAHYNMNRIRLVWSRIWKVLSDFFVSVGLLENLSVAIFVMDSLRQLAMKFLEREELANYNFQNEFLRPFVIVMQRSNAPEVRELIVRCVSQMVLTRVNNIKSGWKGVFMVFTSAAADDTKSTVLLAFETVEKIVRDYFHHITETETRTFTDCVTCLIAFTSSQFNSDANLNAIAFLRFCAVKLAEEGFICQDRGTEQPRNLDMSGENATVHKDSHASLWVPLLAGLAKLTSDPRLTIKKGAVGVLFDILKDHGHLFSQTFWTDIFERVVYPLFSSERSTPNDQILTSNSAEYNLPDIETQTLAVKCLVGLFVNFFDVIRPELARAASIVTYFVRSPYKHCATTGVSAFLRLTEGVGNKLSKEEWKEILVCFKESVIHTFVIFSKIVRMMQDIEIPDRIDSYSESEQYSDHEIYSNDEEEANMETTSYAIVKLKNHMALLLVVIQNIFKLHEEQRKYLYAEHISILLEMVSAIATHSSEVSSESSLQMKFHKACSLLEVSEPAIVHFENESYQSYLKLLQALQHDYPSLSEDMNIESQILQACEKILRIYLKCAGHEPSDEASHGDLSLHCAVPLSAAKKEELSARTSLLLQVMKLLGNLERDSFSRILPCFFPLLVDLIRCEHSSGEVQHALYNIFRSIIGPVIRV
ncbi:brefeldin A-inhibited guanine nucleotide-exchange protein 1-like isoform X1 [Phragmites australis]|uniref:brefeldin A-inhibited guanine nucleotide-exchange protein 1-like isoform X1 n=1 Tax=Phragmites australis TaxID=29695 RepID=UPI002D774F88|nr:brefeldin A-inhibited guanine nucleotide-exchange protein 1-like isoform X1 [Phragmites australis]